MAAKEVIWYELIGKDGTNPNLLVQCECFANALSLEEIKGVEMYCVVPFVKLRWMIQDRQRNILREETVRFGPEGVTRIILGEQIPLEQLRQYETETADYWLNTVVTLASGQDVASPFAFRVRLHKGKSTTSVPQKDLRSQLEAIPVANASMTGQQLRQICLDYIRLELEFPYRMEEDFVYTIQSQKRARRLLSGKVYGGIPYVSRGAGNLYRIAEIYDPATGNLNRDSDIFDDIRYFGNACSGSASMAWARVVTSAYLGYTMFMTEANGFLPVGPYKYPVENLTQFSPNGVRCTDMCSFNGEAVMYESYARLLPADGIVCDGHVRMNSKAPQVVRNADGTIDPDQSIAWMREQNCYVGNPVNLRLEPDGTHHTVQGFVDAPYSFRTLFQGGYIPFTFREFANPALVEPARIRLAVEPELRERVLTANYPISDIFLELDGKRWAFRNMEFFRKEVKMGDIFPPEALTAETKIYCQLLNGQLLEVLQ